MGGPSYFGSGKPVSLQLQGQILPYIHNRLICFQSEVHRDNHAEKTQSSAQARRKLDLKRWYKRREFVLCTSRLVRESRSEQFGYNEDAELRPESAPEPNRSRRTAFVPVPHQHTSQPGEAHAGSRRHSRRTVNLFSDRMSLHTSERARAVRNHKESRKAEEENWRKRRPTILRLHKRFDERRALDMEARKDFEKSQIECSISEHDRCERCGSLNCEKVLERDAWVVTQDFCHEVRIPLYKCLRYAASQIGTQPFYSLSWW